MKSSSRLHRPNIADYKKQTPGVNYLLLGTLAALILSGCAESNLTNPPRSVTEQLLLSTAADRAIKSREFDLFDHKKVFVDGTYFDSIDSKYVIGSIRDALSQAGALLVSEATNSEIIVEPRSGGLSIDSGSSLIGIPSTGVPIPLAGTLSIPELALYKASHQDTYAKLAILAYETKSREHFYSSGAMLGKSYHSYRKFLGIVQWNNTDVPELKRQKKTKGHDASGANSSTPVR